MDNFKRKIRSRTIFLILLFVSLIAIYLVLFLNQDKLLKPSSDIMNFHGGALTSIGILLILDILRYLRAIKDDSKLKELYIKENDERTIMIMQKTGAAGINICILGLGIATVVAGYFNELIFFTLLGATLFVALVKGLFKLYYFKKI
jgi:hypothetical protein